MDRLEEMGDDPVEARDLLAAYVNRLPDRLGLRGLAELLQLPGDKLQVDRERVERVAELVGDAGGEEQDGRRPLVLDPLLGRQLVAGDVGQDDRVAQRAAALVVAERHHVEAHGALLGV